MTPVSLLYVPVIISIWCLSKRSVFHFHASPFPSFHQHHYTPSSTWWGSFSSRGNTCEQIAGGSHFVFALWIWWVCLHETGTSQGRKKAQLWLFFFYTHGGMLTRECASQSRILEGWWSALCGHAAACGLRRWSGRKAATVEYHVVWKSQ